MKGPIVLLTLYSSVFIRSAKFHVSSVDIVVEEGETVALMCSFDPCIDGNQVVFTKNSSVLAPTVLSSGLVQLLLSNVTSSQSGIYTCKDILQNLGQCESFIKTFRVSVFRRPLQPKIVRCVVIDWKWAECTWIPSTAEQLNYTLMKNRGFIHQSLYIRHLKQSLVWHPVNCTPLVNESCRWSLEGSDFDYFHLSDNETSAVRRELTICFRVDVLNLKLPSHSVSSGSHCINFDDYVLLSNVTTANITPTSRSAHLRWKQYRMAPGFTRSAIFKISYRYQWPDKTEWSEVFANISEVNLVSLHPNSLYTVRIQAATVGSKIMSSAVDMKFRTGPTAPCKPPTVNENTFYVKSLNKSHRIVTVYWKSVSEMFRCGDEFGYVVRVTSLDAPPTSYVTNLTSMSIPVSVWESRIDILARNSRGFSPPPDQWIRIPGALHPHDHYKESIEISERCENGTLIVEWNLKKNLSEKTEQLEFFWCDRLNDHLCLGDLNALSVPLSEKKIELNFTRSCENYLIGFALDSENSYSDGINWIECSCSGSLHSKDAKEISGSNADSGERLICLNAREMSAMVVGYIIVVVLGTVILIGIARKCWIDSYKDQIGKIKFPEDPPVKLLEDVGSAYKDELGVNESSCPLLKVISVTPDESGRSKETTLLAIPIKHSNSSEISQPFCVYVLPKINNQIPIASSNNALIPTTRIYFHYNPSTVDSPDIEVYTSQSLRCNNTAPTFYHSDGYSVGCASNERPRGNLEKLPGLPDMLKCRTESVESDETDEMATPLLSGDIQQIPRKNSVALYSPTSGRNDKSVDEANLACRISFCTTDSHSAETVIMPSCDGVTILPGVSRQISSPATESLQDYNCASSFHECPPCTFSGSVDDDDDDDGYTPQRQRMEEEVHDNSCGSNCPSTVLPQLQRSDSTISDFGYTEGCARNEYLSDEREIIGKPAAKLSSIDSW